MRKIFNIVLHEPEIPQNTGNIIRTCAATGANLHLIEPLGFKLDEKSVKRAGLDYFDMAKIYTYKNLDEFFEKNNGGNFYYLSTKASKNHSEISYKLPCFIMFGKESKGLPEDLIFSNLDHAMRVPMAKDARSLNLSNAVAITIYEVLRQHDFKNLL